MKVVNEEKKKIVRPDIGDEVWCLFRNSIFRGEVYALGDKSFILKGYETCVNLMETYEWKFEDFEKKWFFDLDNASDELLSLFEGVLEQFGDGYYEVV